MDAELRWSADVCAGTGTQPNALMQLDAISRRAERSGRTDGDDPLEGHLVPEALQLVCRTLALFTEGQQC